MARSTFPASLAAYLPPQRAYPARLAAIDAAQAEASVRAHGAYTKARAAEAFVETGPLGAIVVAARARLEAGAACTSEVDGAAFEMTIGSGTPGNDHVSPLVDLWIATAGVTHALEAIAASTRFAVEGGFDAPSHLVHAARDGGSPESSFARGLSFGWNRLRARLSDLDEAAWEKAKQTAAALREGAPLATRIGLAYLFPDVPEWAESDAREALESSTHRLAALVHLAPSLDVATLEALIAWRGSWGWGFHGTPASLLLRFGDAATALVARYLDCEGWVADEDFQRACAEGLAWLASPASADALAARLELRAIAPMVIETFFANPRWALPALAARVASHRNDATARAVLAMVSRSAGAPMIPDAALDALPPAFTKREKTKPFPAFVHFDGFTRPLLRDRKTALPLAAVSQLGTWLREKEPSAERIAEVKATCDGATLAAFAWDLFTAWRLAGAPPKESWAMRALGFLGDDACARELAPLLRAWPREGASKRAIAGLDVLSAIGTDVALMQLHAIATDAVAKTLHKQANATIDAIAKARGLTAEDLGDRLVPTFGLDAAGTLVLDFGPRQFTVGFDEQLAPFVRADGVRLPKLPKPATTDDQAAANAATKTWRALVKDIATVATQTRTRLERAMCSRRRWSTAAFRACLVEHPLVGHVVRRLVWGVYRGTVLERAFRVAEDRTFADSADATLAVTEDATIGLVHPLDLGAEELARWSAVFADYEIFQPFPQLAREVAAPAEGETLSEVTRFTGRPASDRAIARLFEVGWRRGATGSGGRIESLEKAFSATFEATIATTDDDRIGEIVLHGDDALGPIAFSEVVRDLELAQAP